MDKKIKVIIADDIQKIAEMNRDIVIQNENINVIGIAYNGQEELDMILQLNPDLVITDNKMPIKDGIDVINEINHLDIENKPDFILVTGEYSLDIYNKCNKLGVFKVLNKLSSNDNLLRTIEEYIDERNTIKEQSTSKTEVIYTNNNDKQIGILRKILEKLKKEV